MSDTVTEANFVVSYAREKFPSEYGPQGQLWKELFNAHGQEVRGRNMKIFWSRYYAIERDNRLIWIVARDEQTGVPVGYSCHWWYVDMHFGDVVGADDLWYVIPGARHLGIGRRVKEIGLSWLKHAGAERTYDIIRAGAPNEVYRCLDRLGYQLSGHRFVFDFCRISKNAPSDPIGGDGQGGAEKAA